jgi:hypothetical protein
MPTSLLRRLLAVQTRRSLPVARRAFRPRLESLEDRTVPSTVTWISTQSGDWADGSNWSSGSQPTAADDVIIDQPGVTVTHSSGTDSVHSLTNSADLALAGGSLSVATTIEVDGTLELGGGTLNLTNKTLDGSGMVTNEPGSSWELFHSVIKTALDNQGALQVRGGVDIQGAFSNDSGATLTVIGDGTGTVNFQILQVDNGFTNDGEIDMTGNNGFICSMGGGTLVNGSDGTIHTLIGNGGSRTINTPLDNEGTITVDGPLDVNIGHNVADVNNGTINVAGGDASFGGFDSTSSFTNNGAFFIDAGYILSVGINDMQFTEAAGGSVTGTGTLHLNRTAATFAGDFNTNGVNLSFENAMSYNSAGTLTISAGSTLTLLRDPTVNAAVENAGTIIAQGQSPTITGTFASDAGSTIQVVGSPLSFGSTLKLTGDVTNHGLIQLSSVDGAYDASLVLSGGTLDNATDGTIEVLAGTFGPRSITASLVNEGTILLHTNTLALNGDYTQTSDGTFSVEIGSNDVYGRLNVSGSATLDGTLSIALVNGYTAPGGASFKILTYSPGSLTGTFATQDDGGLFTTSYNNADLTLTAN